MTAPMISWAMVPTTISDSAVATLSQIDSRVATRARPSQSAARAHTWVISASLHLARPGGPDEANRVMREEEQACSYPGGGRHVSAALKVGVISLAAVAGDSIPGSSICADASQTPAAPQRAVGWRRASA